MTSEWLENLETLEHGVGTSGQNSLMVLGLQTPTWPSAAGGHYSLERASTCLVLADAAEAVPPPRQPVPHSKELCSAPLLVTKLLTGMKSYNRLGSAGPHTLEEDMPKSYN